MAESEEENSHLPDALNDEPSECLTLDLHSPSEPINQWERLMDVDEFVASRRSKHTIVQFNENSIYVFGGDNGKAMLNDLIRYDIKDKSWGRAFTTGSPPAPRYHHSASIYGKSMFIFGGYTGDIHSNSNLTNRNDLYEYNMATGQWSEVKYEGKYCPVPRSAHGAAVYDNKLWIFAGYDGNVRLNDLWYIPLDKERREWTLVNQEGQCPPTCCNFSVAVARDCMCVFSGQSGQKTTNDLFIFHFKTHTWTRISAIENILHGGPAPPFRRYGHTMVAFDRYLYVLGGSTSADFILPSDLHCYDLDTMTWSIIKPNSDVRPSGRLYHAATIIGDAMYIFGGTDNRNVRSSELFRFRFARYPRCTLHQDFERLLTRPDLAGTLDITFLLGQKNSEKFEKIDAHIAVVAARSSAMRKEIENAKTKQHRDPHNFNGSSKLELNLENIDPLPFRIVLEFMYTDKVDYSKRKYHAGSNQMVLLMMDVYMLSVSFEMRRLEHLCMQYLKSAINIENVLVAVQNAHRLELNFIKESCMKFIVKEDNFTNIVMSEEFEALSKELILEIIRRKHKSVVKLSDMTQNNNCESGCCSRLTEDMESFLKETGKEFADIKLQVDQHVILAHKAILVARCSFFEAMFRFSNNDSSFPSDQKIQVKIGEIVPSLQALQSLLRYIYYGNVDMPPEDSLYLFSAPAYYGFTNNRLQAFCKQILETDVSHTNVFKILIAAERINAIEMKKHALDIIVANYKDLFRLPLLKDLPRNLLLDILGAMGENS